jgi:hypothetical protein
VAVEKPPERADPGFALMLVQKTPLDLPQCQIRLAPNQIKQPFLVVLER